MIGLEGRLFRLIAIQMRMLRSAFGLAAKSSFIFAGISVMSGLQQHQRAGILGFDAGLLQSRR